jgi:hypothetical protein
MLEYAMPFTPTYTGDIVALGEQKCIQYIIYTSESDFSEISLIKFEGCLPNEKQIKCDGQDEPVNSLFFSLRRYVLFSSNVVLLCIDCVVCTYIT